jgi:L-iditol 2-dehydrogenase
VPAQINEEAVALLEPLGIAIHLVQRGLVELDPLVTHRFPLTQVSAAFTTASARTGLKTIVLP